MDFLGLTPNTWETKVKIDKKEYIKLKNFCVSKDIINRIKSQPTEWEKICANHTADKGLISRIYILKKKTPTTQ